MYMYMYMYINYMKFIEGMPKDIGVFNFGKLL